MFQVQHIDAVRDTGSNATVKAYTNEILSTIREIVKLNPMFREHVQYFVQTVDLQDSWKLVCAACVCALLRRCDTDVVVVVVSPCRLTSRRR
jgi:hypothetical protein